MKKSIAKTLAAMAAATALPVVVAAAPAQAACGTADKLFALDPANSAVFNAHSGCDGLWALYPNSLPDEVRGQYYVPGEGWKQSSYQWQPVDAWNAPKIIGDTVTDRKLRGEGRRYLQTFLVKY